MKYEISYGTSNPTKTYEVNDIEEAFFDAVYNEIGEGVHLERMSDGTLSVYYQSYPIGKVKLRGRKHKMQILKGLYGMKWIEGSKDDFLPYIADWKKYAAWVVK